MGNYADFEGGNEHNSAKASQKYLGEIRKLSITRSPNGLHVSLLNRYSNPEFLRRDLNTTYTIMPDGKTLGAAAYGGVFTKDQLNFSRPIYFGPSASPWVDDGYEQKMSTYACAKLLVYDTASNTMYTTFFGGISRWFWNYKKGEFETNPSSEISPRIHITMAWNGSTRSVLWPARAAGPRNSFNHRIDCRPRWAPKPCSSRCLVCSRNARARRSWMRSSFVENVYWLGIYMVGFALFPVNSPIATTRRLTARLPFRRGRAMRSSRCT